jgi:hypothetical protein
MTSQISTYGLLFTVEAPSSIICIYLTLWEFIQITIASGPSKHTRPVCLKLGSANLQVEYILLPFFQWCVAKF